MRRTSIRLFSFAWPIALLPLMNTRLSEFPEWIVGPQGRSLLSQIITQILTVIVDALLLFGVNGFFGLAA